jgi:hypothetical protein
LDKKSKAFNLFNELQNAQSLTLFYETEESFISHLWVLDHFYRHDSIVKLLNELGKKCRLCLAENGGKAVNLREESCIIQYFDEKI